MSKFTAEMVDNYADKLLIGLTPEENEMVLNEFDAIDESINLINKVLKTYLQIVTTQKAMKSLFQK